MPCSYCGVGGHEIDVCPERLEDKFGNPAEEDEDEREMLCDGRGTAELVILSCPECAYEDVTNPYVQSITSCPNCQVGLEIDCSRVPHECPETPDVNHVIVRNGRRCLFCKTEQQPVAADGGTDSSGTVLCWDHEDCPRDGCDGELQQQDRYNVMCLTCEEVWSHLMDDLHHALVDENAEIVIRKPQRPQSDDDHEDVCCDGGTVWGDLSGFQRDCLEEIQRLDRDGETSYGLAIKDRLETQYDEVNHGQLYPNLDTLVDRGLVEKSELDRRTNEYTLTDEGCALLIQRVERLADACEMAIAAVDGSREVGRK